MAYTKEDCLNNLIEVATALKHSPTVEEYVAHPLRGMSIQTISKICGSFSKAKKAAELEYRTQHDLKCSRTEFLKNLKLIGNEIGRAPTVSEYEAHPKHIVCVSTVRKRFGGWWDVCLEAGLPIRSIKHGKTSPDKYHENIKQTLLQDLYNIKIRYPNISISKAIIYTGHNHHVYTKYIGNIKKINEALKLRYGILPTEPKNKIVLWTKEIIEEEFKRVTLIVGHKASSREMQKYGIYKNFYEGIRQTYGTYNNLIKAMGYIPWNHKISNITIEQDKKYCIHILRQVIKREETSNWKAKDFFNACQIKRCRIQRLFNGIQNWFKEAKVPIPKKIINKVTKENITDEDVINSIKKMAKKLGRAPYYDEYNNDSKKIASNYFIYHRFGSYTNLIKAAGLHPYANRKLTREEIIQRIINIQKDFGHLPSKSEYRSNPEKYISHSMIYNHFGSWDKALEAAGLK